MALNLLKRSETAGPLTANEHDQNFTDIETEVNAKAPAASPTFTGTVTVPDGSFTIAKTNGLQTALDAKEDIANLGELAYLDVADLPPTYIPTYVEVTAAEVQAGYTVVRDGPVMLVVLPATEALTAEGTINLDITTQVDGDRVRIARRDTGPFNLIEGETGLILKPGGDVADFQWSDTASAWIATEDTSVGRRAQIASSSSTLSVTAAHVGTDILHSAACAVGIPAAALQPGDDGRHIQEGATDVITLSATSGAFALATTPVSTSGAGSAIYWWIDVGGDIRTRFEPPDGGRGVLVENNTDTIVIGPGDDGKIIRLTHTAGAIGVTLSNDCPPNLVVELILETAQTVTVTPEAGASYIDAPGSTATAAFVITGDWGARVVSNSDGSSAVYNDYGSTNRPVSGITFGTGITFTPVSPTTLTADRTLAATDHDVVLEVSAATSPRVSLPSLSSGTEIHIERPFDQPTPIFIPNTSDVGISGPSQGFNRVRPGGRATVRYGSDLTPVLSGDLMRGELPTSSDYSGLVHFADFRRGEGLSSIAIGASIETWSSVGTGTADYTQATVSDRPVLNADGTLRFNGDLLQHDAASALSGNVFVMGFAGRVVGTWGSAADLMGVYNASNSSFTECVRDQSFPDLVGQRWLLQSAQIDSFDLVSEQWFCNVIVADAVNRIAWIMTTSRGSDPLHYIQKSFPAGTFDPSVWTTTSHRLGRTSTGTTTWDIAAAIVLHVADAAVSGGVLDLDLPLRVLGHLQTQLPPGELA